MSKPTLFPVAGLVLLAAALPGCVNTRYYNTARYIDHDIVANQDESRDIFRDACTVPARDILLLDPLWRGLLGSEAWNVPDGDVPDSSFFTNRSVDDLKPECIALGAATDPPPQPPFKISKKKTVGVTPGFIGEDASGRKFMIKPDHPDYPEQGSAAELITSRLLWAAGYNVPAVYIITIEGTGDPVFDGRRALASEFVKNVRGNFRFDWFRYRREVRGLRLASAWLNDMDRVSTNTLVVMNGDRADYYLVDFNSSLGSWQGQPKLTWHGWRSAGDIGWGLLTVISLGAVRPEPAPPPPIVSPAIGRFDAEQFQPLAWRTHLPNNAFEHMSPADMHWMIGILQRIERPQIEAVVAAAKFSREEDARYMIETLLARREKILKLAGDSRPQVAARE